MARARALGNQQKPSEECAHGSVPLIGFPPGCLYRSRATHALESSGRAWHMAYTSSSLAGIQAAVAAGMGLSILSEMAIQAEHRVPIAKDGFTPIDKTAVGWPRPMPVPRRFGLRTSLPSSATGYMRT